MAKGVAASVSTGASAGNDPHYKQLQNAHEGYFKDVADIWAKAQGRYQTIQTEYQRSVEKAFFNQEPELFQAANDSYQQALELACADTSAFDDYAGAYRGYKAAIRDMLASADIDDLSFTDMAQLSQSLFAVSQTAMGLTCAPAATYNNPFEMEAGAAEADPFAEAR